MKLLGITSVGFNVANGSTSAIQSLQESMSFSEGESIVQYSHRVWGIHETSQAD
jgi:hypothetical protein